MYYEASGSVPAKITEDTIASAFPIGTKFRYTTSAAYVYTVVGYNGDAAIIQGIDGALNIYTVTTWGENMQFFRPDDLVITTNIISITGPTMVTATLREYEIKFENNLIDNKFVLPWHNCYTFKNGVESNRIRDNFNLPYISNGVKASTTLEQEYKEEHRKYGLIYSGIYNSTSGINNLNQFIAGEKITKDVNPIYGSIQKLYSRDSDLVALCEDKILRIVANKDALFNADGNPQLIATNRVLGQTVPFTGEYGISTNPESFASESYRGYFADKVRGAVIRMSKDGLTPISDAGMKDWFRDNLKGTQRILGSYDDRNDEYNLALNFEQRNITVTATPGSFGPSSGGEKYKGYEKNKVLSFSEKVGGWVSFKSFTDMQQGVSLANKYYTFESGRLFLHHDDNSKRNFFYGVFTPSTLDVILNSDPGAVKVFNTLNYEGSQSRVEKFESERFYIPFQPNTTYNNSEPYNLHSKPGWWVESITTNKEEGYVNEFLEKEGKWFNGISKTINYGEDDIADTADFTFQGIAELESWDYYGKNYPNGLPGKLDLVLRFKTSNLNTSLQVGDLIYARRNEKQLGSDVWEDDVSRDDLEGYDDLMGRLVRIEHDVDKNNNNLDPNEFELYVSQEMFPGQTKPFFTPATPKEKLFIMFSKYNQTLGDVIGYYASVKLVNDSQEKAEIFSVGSEVIINSK